ncbi:MAG: Hpt domain-containing protein, partial [Synergistaceae bacterium]|nr:Hpt domain-containing protein [Synergistaceae bacterium]
LKADFVAGNRNRFDEIMNALKANDIKLAHRLVHTLKSNAGLIGKTTLQKTAAEAERMLIGGESRVTESQMSVLQIELDSALDELAPNLTEATSHIRPDVAADLDESVVRKLLDELEPLLESGNPECRKMIDDIRVMPGSDELVRQMEDYDFDAAAVALSEMKKIF